MIVALPRPPKESFKAAFGLLDTILTRLASTAKLLSRRDVSSLTVATGATSFAPERSLSTARVGVAHSRAATTMNENDEIFIIHAA